jgi:hypothetical protein
MALFKLGEDETLINSFKKSPVATTLIVLFLSWLFVTIWADLPGPSYSPTQQPAVAAIQKDIVVTSQTVKQVNGKHRYFFDIRNNDTSPFTGAVNIELLKTNGTKLGQGDFGATSAIQPGLGDYVYIDIRTAPVSISGVTTGISDYKYEVISNNQIVSSGSGKIVTN